jgi:hypothetical protein
MDANGFARKALGEQTCSITVANRKQSPDLPGLL